VFLVARLLGMVVAGLGAQHCAQPARDAAQGVIEAVLEYGDEAAEKLLGSHMGNLLEALRGIAVSGSGASRPKQNAKAKKVGWQISVLYVRTRGILAGRHKTNGERKKVSLDCIAHMKQSHTRAKSHFGKLSYHDVPYDISYG